MSTLRGGPNTVMDGLIMYMDAANTKCYPGTGTSWNDLSINGNNGTLMAPITFASSPGRFETNATASTDFKQILSTNTLNFADTSEYSFDFFVKLRTGWTTGSTFHIFTGLFSGNPFVSVRPVGGTSWQIWWRQAPSGVYVVGSTISTIDITNTWVNFSFVITSNRVVTIYLNGTFLQTLTLATSEFNVNRIASAYNAGDGSYYTLQGDIATARYYNQALSSNEVLQNYNALKGRFGL